MIRGVDREIRKSIKDAARAEGISVGTWVRRCLLRALKAPADDPATVMDLHEQMRKFEARLDVIEKSNRALQQKIHVTDTRTRQSASEKRTRWRRTRKSKSS
ncbi:MAG: hypothetical protein AB7E84_04275 [Xanthobacteraceae bacterium]